jgi:hypothetical protein
MLNFQLHYKHTIKVFTRINKPLFSVLAQRGILSNNKNTMHIKHSQHETGYTNGQNYNKPITASLLMNVTRFMA